MAWRAVTKGTYAVSDDGRSFIHKTFKIYGIYSTPKGHFYVYIARIPDISVALLPVPGTMRWKQVGGAQGDIITEDDVKEMESGLRDAYAALGSPIAFEYSEYKVYPTPEELGEVE